MIAVVLKRVLLAAIALLSCDIIAAQPNSIGGYNVYYGSIHNHSNYSADAKGFPQSAYKFARDSSHLDFLGLAEHCVYLTQQEWDSLAIIADDANRDSSFTALRGFEWSSSSKYGHIAILNTDSFTSVSFPATGTFDQISGWISRHDGIAFFNHPGRENANGTEFSHFTAPPNKHFVGMELWNRGNGFNNYYYNDGYYVNDTNKSYFDEALSRGWRIGASGSEDNHTANWGRSSNFRMAVLAKANTRSNILDAFKNRRFYSTLDKNLALSFKIDGTEMGDSASAGDVTVRIETFDADHEQISKIELKKQGQLITTWQTAAQRPVVREIITCSPGEYYYAVVTEADGDQAISSPIFIGEPKPACDTVYLYDTIIVIDTNFVTDTVIVTDTNLVIDTIFIEDTAWVIDTTFTNDTIWNVDTIIRIDTVLVTDTSYVIDTVVVYDTVLVRKYPASAMESTRCDVTVYPVPCRDVLYVDNPSGGVLSIVLYDASMRVILARGEGGTFVTLDTRTLTKGVYVLTVGNTHSRKAFKIFK